MTDAYRNVTIIPARLGSTRLTNKNLRMVAGRPSLCWVLDQVVNVSGDLIVSIEPDGRGNNVEWAVHHHCGAPVRERVHFHRRGPATCTPESGVGDVVNEVLDHLDSPAGPWTQVTIVLATAALLNGHDVLEMLRRSRVDGRAHMTVTRMYLDPDATLLLGADGGLHRAEQLLGWPAERLVDAQRRVIDAGMAYTYPISLWREYGFYPPDGRLRPYPLRRTDAVDVDEEEDARLLEILGAVRHLWGANDYNGWRPR